MKMNIVSGGVIIVLLCLADCSGGAVKYDVSDLHQIRSERHESVRFLYFVLGSAGNLIREYGKLNWAPFVLGIVIVGLEVGWIYAYKAGWQVSTGFIVQSAFLAAALLLVGYVLYHESLSWNKIVGVMICLIGLGFINYT